MTYRSWFFPPATPAIIAIALSYFDPKLGAGILCLLAITAVVRSLATSYTLTNHSLTIRTGIYQISHTSLEFNHIAEIWDCATLPQMTMALKSIEINTTSGRIYKLPNVRNGHEMVAELRSKLYLHRT